MRKYEYKVVPVPAKCLSTRGAGKGTDPACFTIETVLNHQGVEGWEFVRSDCVRIRKRGLFGRGEIIREMLVFRRQPVLLADRAPAPAPAPERTPVEEFAQLPSPEQIRARRVTRPDLLEGAKSGRRRITPRPTALVDENATAQKPVMAAE